MWARGATTPSAMQWLMIERRDYERRFAGSTGRERKLGDKLSQADPANLLVVRDGRDDRNT